jgi:D-alanyl-D-alanine carboxypeptidase
MEATRRHARWRAGQTLLLGLLAFSVSVTMTAPARAAVPLQAAMDNIVAAGYPAAYVNDTGLTAASGVADLTTGQPATADLNMRAGSITKTLVATVALQLVDQGTLRLDDTVQRWLPGLLPYGRQVTVQMLLQHTSGIPDYWEDGQDALLPHFLSDPGFRDLTWTPRQLVGLIADLPPEFTPGFKAKYSDTNYIVAGMIVEQATGHLVGDEIQNRIIAPLGLSHTSFPTTSTTLPAPFTHGYSLPLDSNGKPIAGATPVDFTTYNTSVLWATGALISNPNDINTFYRALLGGRLLSARMMLAMKATVPLHQPGWPPGVGFGLGIWSWKLQCGITVWGHEGEVPGFNTYAFASPDGRRSITMQITLLKATDSEFNVGFSNYVSLWCG